MNFVRRGFPVILGVAMFAMLAMLGISANATTFLVRPFPETVSDAPNIVRGTVGSSYSDWGKGLGDTKRIYTFTELQVNEVFKGSVEKNAVIMRELGGSKDGIGLEIPGTARFNRGEDIVVMLGPSNSDGSYDVRGMMMGKYNIARDQDGTEYLTGPGLASAASGMIHDDHHEEKDQENKGQADTKRWTLDALRKLAHGEDAEAAPVNPIKPSPVPMISASAAQGAATVKTPTASPSAPQLQSSSPCGAQEPCADSSGSRGWSWGIAGIVGIVLAIFAFRRGRRSRR